MSLVNRFITEQKGLNSMGGPSEKHTGPNPSPDHNQVRLGPWKPEPETGDWMMRAIHRNDRIERGR